MSLSKTPAVLLLDEDIALSSDEVRFAFAVFREFPDRLVGFAARNHLWDADRKLWRYSSKVRITKSGRRCFCHFSPTLAYNLHSPPANGKLRNVPNPAEQKESRESGLGTVHAAYIIKPTQTRINRKKCTFCVIKSLEQLKNIKNGPVPYLGLELSIRVTKSQIHRVRQSL